MTFISFTSLSIIGQGQDSMNVVLEELEVTYVKEQISEENVITLDRKDFNILPGSFDDPTRLLLKYQGVSTSNDQANSIIYRGMPSHYTSWMFNGVQIVNPNHTSNAGTAGDLPTVNSGGVNMIGGQMLDQAVFYGSPNRNSFNSLSGVTSLTSTSINRYVQASLLGLEAGYQIGPFSAGYRYSFTGLLADIGVDFGGEEIRYSDLNLRFHPKLEKGKLLMSFVLGKSSNLFSKSNEPASIKEYQDISYKSFINIGTIKYERGNHTWDFGYSIREDRRKANGVVSNEKIAFDIEDKFGYLPFKFNLNYSYVTKVFRFGVISVANLTAADVKYQNTVQGINPLTRSDSYIEEQIDFSFYINKIFHFNHFTTELQFNPIIRLSSKEFSPDFHFKMKKEINQKQNVTLSFGRQSQNQPYFVYLYKSNDLDLISTKSYALNLAYNLNLSGGHKLEVQTFGHLIQDVPQTTLGISSINAFEAYPHFGDEFVKYDNARIFGLSGQYEKSANQFWWSINGSLFSAQYRRNGKWFDTTQDYGHTLNLSFGKVWDFSKKTKFLRLGFSIHERGGAKLYPIDENFDRTQFSYAKGPIIQLSNYWRIDTRVSYNVGKNIWSLDIQNITNRRNESHYILDYPSRAQSLQKQLGLLPVLSFRRML